MKKFLICGAFGFENMDIGGQPVKTRELYYGLQELVGEDQVDYIETSGWKKHPLHLLKSYFSKAHNSKNIIMLPAHKGVIVFSRLLLFSKKINRKKIYYDVIGGWLPATTEKDMKLKNTLSYFDGIWVETTIMRRRLFESGLSNVSLVRNFKNLTPVNLDDNSMVNNEDLHLCTFSRVMKEKGIEDAINATIEIREKYQKKVFLDVYGFVDIGYKEQFEEIKKSLPDYIKYCGVVSPSESVETLKDYDALLFPTRFKTEGLPGTIIDAYAAGIPVISAKWDSYSDIIDDGRTGIGYTQFDYVALVDSLVWAYDHSSHIREMKKNCVIKAREFSRPYVLQKLIDETHFD